MPTFPSHLEKQIQQIPRQPGVYLMKNKQGHVIYVGKAVVLANRVRSYFQHRADASPKTCAMVDQIEEIETVVTRSDLEALLLENNLIKKYHPKYNILLRDDKSYPMLRLPIHEPFPRLEIVRRMTPSDKSLYFGPYIPSGGLYEMMRMLRTLFPIPNCTIPLDGKAERPCIEFEIKRCLAPCTGNQSQEDYQEMIRGVRLFLEGKNHLLLKQLRQKMTEQSRACQYEEAARLCDQIKKIQRALEHQRIVSSNRENQDVIAIHRALPISQQQVSSADLKLIKSRKEDIPPLSVRGSPLDTPINTCAEPYTGPINIFVLFVRNGMVTGKKEFFIETGKTLADEEMISQFVSQFYSGDRLIPPYVILPLTLPDQTLLQKGLSEKCGKAVRLISPTRGPRKQLVRLALQNATRAVESQYQTEQKGEDAVMCLQSLCNLSKRPNRIEGYDISNIMGDSAVGSRVVFEKGLPKKTDYRHFKIKTLWGANDFAMMAEVLRRRLLHPDASPLPDLILIDGGKGQLSAVQEVFKAAGIDALPLVGLAKERENHPERIYRLDWPDPMDLPEGSSATHLLMQIRDEAHRFAVSYHRKVRAQKMLRSPLEEIAGIGKQRHLALLRHFGSLAKIREASLEEIETAPSMNKPIAQKLFHALHSL